MSDETNGSRDTPSAPAYRFVSASSDMSAIDPTGMGARTAAPSKSSAYWGNARVVARASPVAVGPGSRPPRVRVENACWAHPRWLASIPSSFQGSSAGSRNRSIRTFPFATTRFAPSTETGFRIPAVDGVEPEQVREIIDLGEIIGGHEIKAGLIDDQLQERAPDPRQAVDSDARAHLPLSSCSCRAISPKASAECAYEPPARISTATQMASMIWWGSSPNSIATEPQA